ncbi:hypothetical protein AB0N81_01215 [Streptomyces sp. NPDC093510]
MRAQAVAGTDLLPVVSGAKAPPDSLSGRPARLTTSSTEAARPA